MISIYSSLYLYIFKIYWQLRNESSFFVLLLSQQIILLYYKCSLLNRPNKGDPKYQSYISGRCPNLASISYPAIKCIVASSKLVLPLRNATARTYRYWSKIESSKTVLRQRQFTINLRYFGWGRNREKSCRERFILYKLYLFVLSQCC